MPLFPSQDGPYHLYLVNIFRHLLMASNPTYSATYFVGRYLPPYSLYYYGLIGLGHFMSLETADKVMVSAFFVVFSTGIRSLLSTVSGNARWSQFLALPILLNWSLMMGFVNYELGTGIACFALSVWCAGTGVAGLRNRAGFLLLVVLTLLTHPIAWMFILAFALFDLGFRLLRSRTARDADTRVSALAFFTRDSAAAVLAACGYFYLRSFQYVVKVMPVFKENGSLSYRIVHRTISYIGEHGLAVFTDIPVPGVAFGGRSLATLMYRILLAFFTGLLVALVLRGLRRELRQGAPSLPLTWSIFSVLFLIAMPFLPIELSGGTFFATRLLALVYISFLVSASPWLRRGRLPVVFAAGAACSALFTLGLAAQRISPIARQVAAIHTLPPVATDKPGLVISHDQPYYESKIDFNPFIWAGAGYFRQHNYVLYNTSWLEESHIPVKVQDAALDHLDSTFAPVPPLNDPQDFWMHKKAVETLPRVGFAIGPRTLSGKPDDVRKRTMEAPLDPAFAGWTCSNYGMWQMCLPPN